MRLDGSPGSKPAEERFVQVDSSHVPAEQGRQPRQFNKEDVVAFST